MVQLRRLKRHVGDELARLGRSGDEVARSLQAAAVLGVPRSNNSCALALYVSALMGSDPAIRSVTVGHCSLHLHLVGPDLRPAGRLAVQLPKPVRQFVAGFDAFEYPSVTRAPFVTVATTGDAAWTDRPGAAPAVPSVAHG